MVIIVSLFQVKSKLDRHRHTHRLIITTLIQPIFNGAVEFPMHL